MVTFLSLIAIGFISGAILAAVMKLIRILTGNKAEILLYNMDYMPFLRRWSDKWITGTIFHYMTCIGSVVILFYLLVPLDLEISIWPYIFAFTVGGGILYFLSALTPAPPAYNDFSSWLIWTVSHGIFGLVAALLIILWF